MQYIVGYYGNNAHMEEQLIEYSNSEKGKRINYLNISDLDSDLIEAISFNGLIFNTSMHESQESNDIIKRIISTNPDIDVMPIISADTSDPNFNALDEIAKENSLIEEENNISTIPYFIGSKREAEIFMNTIFSTLSSKTIRHIEQIKNYKSGAQKNMLKALKKVVIALELKDPYTRDHSRRVSLYAGQIAKKMGLPDEEIKQIQEAGWLHDIGKLAITDSVLMKPGKLTDKEFLHMQTHAALGNILLNNIFEHDEFESIKKYTKHHHERYDGNGYPDNLSGDNIPLGARILCLADSFDAMTTQRSYNKPKKLEDAILDLQENSGTQFDPNAVSSFIELLRQESEMLKETLKIRIDKDGYIQVNDGPKPAKDNKSHDL